MAIVEVRSHEEQDQYADEAERTGKVSFMFLNNWARGSEPT